LGEALLPLINPVTAAKYGIQIASCIVENVSVPAGVEEAIDKRSSMAALGNLNDFQQYPMAKGFGQGRGGAGAAGTASELAVGFAIAQQMMQQTGVVSGQAGTPSVAPGHPGVGAGAAAGVGAAGGTTAPAALALLTPADVAQTLG